MEFFDAIRYFGALFLVLALVAAAGLVVRRFGLPGMAAGAGRRLAIVESMMLGGRHRLFLIRCDGVERLVVLSPQGATVIDNMAGAPKPDRSAA